MTPSAATRRPLILAAVMASMAMIAIEATIVSTAMPQIAGQLGDLHLYSWVFASFLLAQTATTVIFGKLADTFGRKPVLLSGIAIFLVGSILCGFAWSMPSLIVFRLMQGIGAGAIQPVGLTVIGDLYSVEERGKIQGYLASVWGVSSVVGPFAGGLIIEDFSWSWIFWINIPIGLLAAVFFVRFLREKIEPRERSLDFAGAALFTLAVAALMISLTELGTSGSLVVLAALGVSIIAAAGFFVRERRARDPMMDLKLWARRTILTVNGATLLSGMSVIGLTTFLPMYVQGVLGQSALIAGFTLTAMVLGWPIGATIAAKNFGRFGLRRVMLFGASLLPIGAVPFVLLSPGMSPLAAALGSVVMGFGMGFLSTAAIVIIQGSVGWAERGSATASNIFSRNLGSTLGAAALGAVFNIGLAHRDGGAVGFDRIRELLDKPGALAADTMARDALAGSLHVTFWGVFAISVATLLLTLLVPRLTATGAAQPAAAGEEPEAAVGIGH
ncbi:MULTISPECIES: MDR family MFS transporter [unclassified Aureimonas]|uniref:MDR family MFS transporter n=1 Tax=unclassified Aureimonas TaxID=2615206 RepID=UPI0006F4851A|nr:MULTISPECIES: MDR family MFS transporter [unclassified Aureimonas]KQT57364.1 MFS transporter [Aureimonas sp. Leaf427]KQT77042.1 MFS transporter [Aureimonas sp. Leaf460]